MNEAIVLAPTSDELVGTALRTLAGIIAPMRETSRGDIAELRRVEPVAGILPPALWRLLTAPAVEAAIDAFGTRPREAAERAFAIVIQAMCETGLSGAGAVGVVLAETDYAEPRLVRLLRARGIEDVAREARLTAAWCAVKGIPPRFADMSGRHDGLGPFVIAAALRRDRQAERRSHAVARDYFATRNRQSRPQPLPEK